MSGLPSQLGKMIGRKCVANLRRVRFLNPVFCPPISPYLVPGSQKIMQNIVGQHRTQEFLASLATSERVPHALLFLAPTGGGGLALATTFAQLLQCEQSGIGSKSESGGLFEEAEIPITNHQSANYQSASFQPCGECSACRKAAQFAHPDIHFSFPTIGTNAVSTDFLKDWRAFLSETPYADVNTWLQRLGADNKQGNINKEECNAILKKLSLKAFEGRYKILVMWLPEYLGKEGNRLLKLIEEPPEQTIFLLVAENQDLILNTILSRCQLVKFDPLSDEEVAEGLVQQRGVHPERARQIAFLSGGDFGAALMAADAPVADDAQLLLDWLRKCWRGHAVEMVRWTEEFAKLGRENQKQFLHYGLHFLREMLSLVSTGSPTMRLRPEELATAQNMAKVLDFEKIAQIVALLNDNIYYIERNANPKILFLDTSIQMHRIMKSNTKN
jgi:DNA polymerase-3 subunit delta'